MTYTSTASVAEKQSSILIMQAATPIVIILSLQKETKRQMLKKKMREINVIKISIFMYLQLREIYFPLGGLFLLNRTTYFSTPSSD